jgi:hypothetical protein
LKEEIEFYSENYKTPNIINSSQATEDEKIKEICESNAKTAKDKPKVQSIWRDIPVSLKDLEDEYFSFLTLLTL